MDLAEGKVNQMQVLAEHKATDPGKEPKLMTLKAELESLRKVVNKFKKDKSGYESNDSNGSRKQGKGRRTIQIRSAFQTSSKGHPGLMTQASLGSLMESSIGGVKFARSGASTVRTNAP